MIAAGDEPRTEGEGRTAALCLLLERHRWDIVRVARTLHASRATLYERLQLAGLARADALEREHHLRGGKR